MKKFYITYLLCAVALVSSAVLLVACSSDGTDAVDPTTATAQSLTAYYPGYDETANAQTRVGFDKDGNGYWHEGDVIGVWSDTEGKFKPFTVSDGAGTGKATFTGTMKGKIANYAVVLYPYSEKHNIDDTEGTATYNFPNSYTLTSVDKEYYSTDTEGNVVPNINSFNMPMLGNVKDIENSTGDRIVQFHNVGGVAVIKVDKIPETGTVTVTADQAICGDAYITETTKKFSYTDETCKTVTFHYSGAEKSQQGVFCLPLLAGTYTLTVSIEGSSATSDGTGKIDYKYSKTLDSFTLERSHLKRVEVNVGGSYEIYVNGHRFIDLGLESGLLWAEVNLGATVPADYGDYYAWGYTEPMTTTTPGWSYYTKFGTYSYAAGTDCGLTKYNLTDGKNELEPEDDVATVNWGAPCRMPTYDECVAIMHKFNKETTNQWYRLKNSSGCYADGVDIKSNTNGNTVFIPASGYYSGTGHKSEGVEMCLWTKSYQTSSITVNVYAALPVNVSVYNNKPSLSSSARYERYYGLPIRAVVQP